MTTIMPTSRSVTGTQRSRAALPHSFINLIISSALLIVSMLYQRNSRKHVGGHVNKQLRKITSRRQREKLPKNSDGFYPAI